MGTGGRQIVKAAVIVMALFALSRLLGVVRQMAIAAQFGTSGELDAYMAAARIPEMIFLVVAGGALGSAFIPAFAQQLARDDRAGAWRLASAVANLVVIVLMVSAVLIAVFAPALVRTLIAPGFDSEQQSLTVSLLRLMLLSSIIFGASGVVMGALNAHQHFVFPALAPSLYNLSIIGGTLLLGPRLGVRGIAVGVVVGSALHLLVQVPALLRRGARYVPTLGLTIPGVREVGRLMAPRVLGTAITQINFIVNNNLASTMGEGAVSAINYAWLLMLLPQGVLAQAIGTAAFPTFAQQVAQGERDEMRGTLAATLRTVFFLSIPATVGLLALGQPLVGILFERGAFDQSSTAEVAWALAFFALGLVGHSGLEIIARAFYALHDTFTPVWVGGLAMALNLALSLALPGAFASQGWMAHGGLALANSVATLLETGVLLVLIRRRLHGVEGRQMLSACARSGLAALAMGAALLGWRALLADASALLVGGGGVVLGAAVYLGAAALLRAEELRAVVGLVRR
ncbi:MAG: murein biosynthesis integral membrane protein MurJ [Anaerolineae bacterium]|jgi:putative peptidoglycan lipid II flippase